MTMAWRIVSIYEDYYIRMYTFMLWSLMPLSFASSSGILLMSPPHSRYLKRSANLHKGSIIDVWLRINSQSHTGKCLHPLRTTRQSRSQRWIRPLLQWFGHPYSIDCLLNPALVVRLRFLLRRIVPERYCRHLVHSRQKSSRNRQDRWEVSW